MVHQGVVLQWTKARMEFYPVVLLLASLKPLLSLLRLSIVAISFAEIGLNQGFPVAWAAGSSNRTINHCWVWPSAK
jgi:hypothetical protein